jgi:hypothetical protein
MTYLVQDHGGCTLATDVNKLLKIISSTTIAVSEQLCKYPGLAS